MASLAITIDSGFIVVFISVDWGLIAGTVRPDPLEFHIQVRQSFGATRFRLVDHPHPVTSDLATPRKILVSPISQAQDGIIQARELLPVFVALAAEFPYGHPGR